MWKTKKYNIDLFLCVDESLSDPCVYEMPTNDN